MKIIGIFPVLEDIVMRMRRMRNLEPRMEKCGDYRIAEPSELKGNWRSLKPDCTALWVEALFPDQSGSWSPDGR